MTIEPLWFRVLRSASPDWEKWAIIIRPPTCAAVADRSFPEGARCDCQVQSRWAMQTTAGWDLITGEKLHWGLGVNINGGITNLEGIFAAEQYPEHSLSLMFKI